MEKWRDVSPGCHSPMSSKLLLLAPSTTMERELGTMSTFHLKSTVMQTSPSVFGKFGMLWTANMDTTSHWIWLRVFIHSGIWQPLSENLVWARASVRFKTKTKTCKICTVLIVASTYILNARHCSRNLNILTHLTLTQILWSRCSYYPCFTSEKTEAREKVRNFPTVTQPGFKPKQSGSNSLLEPLCYTASPYYNTNS